MAEDLDKFVSAALMTLAGAEQGIEAVVQASPSRWVLGFSDDLQMELRIDEATNRIVLSAEAGTLRDEDRVTTMQALLAFNLLWQETGCLRAGLSPADPTLVLMADLGLPDLTDARLAGLVLRLAAAARNWRAFAAGELADAVPDAVDANMIRV